MTSKKAIFVCTVLCCCCFALISAQAQDTQFKGLVTGRAADSMTVKSMDGTTYNVLLTDDTKVQMPKGLGLRHKEASWTELIPGLQVQVKGNTNAQGQVVASQVEFNKNDLQTASMIQAGLTPTQKEVATNKQNIAANQQGIEANQQQITTNEQKVDQRFAELSDYDVKGDAKVYFAPGSSTLSEQSKATLSQLAGEAVKLSGYLIQVQGFADSTGNLAMNQQLSRDRAEAVIEYLMQDANVPPRHIVAPGAMGISDPVGSNETPQGRADNRRVEAKILVNRGIAQQ
jgi:outer membrane protein OmpA-like peptidoglycan-associated protein